MCSPTTASRVDWRNEKAACTTKIPTRSSASRLSAPALLAWVTVSSKRTITIGKAKNIATRIIIVLAASGWCLTESRLPVLLPHRRSILEHSHLTARIQLMRNADTAPRTARVNLEHQDGRTGCTFQESSLLEYPRLTPKGRVGPAGHRNRRRERITLP